MIDRAEDHRMWDKRSQVAATIPDAGRATSGRTRAGLNTTQRVAVYVGALLIAAMLLYPPWKPTRRTPKGKRTEEPTCYAWIFRPPEGVEYLEYIPLTEEQEAWHDDKLFSLYLRREYAVELPEAEGEALRADIDAQIGKADAKREKMRRENEAAGLIRQRVVYTQTATLESARLGVQCLAVAVVTGMAVIMLRSKDRKQRGGPRA